MVSTRSKFVVESDEEGSPTPIAGSSRTALNNMDTKSDDDQSSKKGELTAYGNKRRYPRRSRNKGLVVKHDTGKLL